jgi:NADH-quinone oxidoreductase subunit H
MLRFFACLASIVVAVGLAALLGACAFDASPQLIQVLDVAPRELELGDKLEIIGNGFPQGRAARVTFRGTLHRPSERALADVEIVADGVVTSSGQVELPFADGLEALFCGGGDGAAHTTFEGEVEVAFAAASAKDAPVAGTLRKVTLDLRPPAPRADVLTASEAEGERALAFMGIHAGDVSPAGGLVVASVDGGSRADDGGVAAGDVIVALDGLRVGGKADMVPSPGAQRITMLVRRGEDPREQARTLDVDGFRSAPPVDLAGAAIVIAVALALLLVFVAPPTRLGAGVVTAFERRVTTRVRAATARASAEPGARWSRLVLVVREVARTVAERVMPRARAASRLVLGGALVLTAAVPVAHAAFGVDPDAAVLFVLSLTALLTVGLVTGGWGAAEPMGVVSGLRALFEIASVELPAALAVAAVVFRAGSTRMGDVVRAQGGAPWDWYAFRSPVTLVLFVLFFARTFASERTLPGELHEADLEPAARASAGAGMRYPFFLVCEWTHVVVMCAMATALFLGGWQVPGVAPAQAESQPWLGLAGALLFVGKAAVLVAGVVLARFAVARVGAQGMVRIAWRVLVPLAVVCFALTIAEVVWGQTLFGQSRAAQRVVGGAIFATSILALVHVSLRVRHGLRGGEPRVALNPFL